MDFLPTRKVTIKVHLPKKTKWNIIIIILIVLIFIPIYAEVTISNLKWCHYKSSNICMFKYAILIRKVVTIQINLALTLSQRKNKRREEKIDCLDSDIDFYSCLKPCLATTDLSLSLSHHLYHWVSLLSLSTCSALGKVPGLPHLLPTIKEAATPCPMSFFQTSSRR